MNILLILTIVALALVIAWQVIPSFREFLRGKTTLFEGAIAASLTAADVAIRQFQMESEFWSTVVPEGAWQYVTIGLALWMIFKRVVTDTGVWEK